MTTQRSSHDNENTNGETTSCASQERHDNSENYEFVIGAYCARRNTQESDYEKAQENEQQRTTSSPTSQPWTTGTDLDETTLTDDITTSTFALPMPSTFSGKEDYAKFLHWQLKPFVMFTDISYGTTIDYVLNDVNDEVTDQTLRQFDKTLGLNAGATRRMSTTLHEVLRGLLKGPPSTLLTFDPTRGFETLRLARKNNDTTTQ